MSDTTVDHRAIIEHAPLPIFVVSGDLKIVFANGAGVDFLHLHGYETAQTVHDLMSFVAPEEREESSLNIARLLADEQSVWRNQVRLVQDSQGRRARALISTSKIEWEGELALVASMVLLEAPQDVNDSRAISGLGADGRRDALVSLTPQEQRIAELVASGYSTANICALLQVADSTVRSHLKAVYRKTETHSRTELTRLLLGIR